MSSPQNDAEIHWVTPMELRHLFNELRIAERASNGELRRRVMDYDNHLNRRQREKMNRDSRTEVRFIRCTRSQIVAFFNNEGKLIALAHQYLRPDGELAGSGLADPKRIYLDNGVYAV